MGDALVVVLIYCFIRIFIPNGLSQLPLYVLAFACFIEILQYFQLVDVLGISNRILRIALGSTFDLKDMVSYAGGYVFILLAEYYFLFLSLWNCCFSLFFTQDNFHFFFFI